MLYDKRDFAGVIKLRILTGGRLSWIIQVSPVVSKGSYKKEAVDQRDNR